MASLLSAVLTTTLLAGYILPKASSTKIREVFIEEGTVMNIPCDLSGTILHWTWRPQYPVCAGVGTGESTPTICTVTANGESRTDLPRFFTRLVLKGDHRKGSSFLILQNTVTSDSGTFGCRSSKGDSITSLLLHVTPGCVNGLQVKTDPAQAELGAHFKMSCFKCIKDNPVYKPFTVSWTRNGGITDPDGLRATSNTLFLGLVKFNHVGLWSCRLNNNASQSREYCLELPQKPTRGTPTESPTNTTGKGTCCNILPLVIVKALSLFLLLGTMAAGWCYVRSKGKTRGSA
nr:PREDICTED: uncharacterized protein LOC106703915 [Latimeria chalumnae]|eukprot:XP_014345237.1 PREDICTED: uncharacterized protein LOC106703915 [Latimeria chalumnae]